MKSDLRGLKVRRPTRRGEQDDRALADLGAVEEAPNDEGRGHRDSRQDDRVVGGPGKARACPAMTAIMTSDERTQRQPPQRFSAPAKSPALGGVARSTPKAPGTTVLAIGAKTATARWPA